MKLSSLTVLVLASNYQNNFASSAFVSKQLSLSRNKPICRGNSRIRIRINDNIRCINSSNRRDILHQRHEKRKSVRLHAEPPYYVKDPEEDKKEKAALSSSYNREQFMKDAQEVFNKPLPGIKELEEDDNVDDVPMPELGTDGVYKIENAKQHKKFLKANEDSIVVMKFYAPWCRACKGLAPKFVSIVKNPIYQDLPIKFAELSIQNNKDFVKSLGVLALPSMQFYVGEEGLIENFPCGPSKVPILKNKLQQVIDDRVDPVTKQLKPYVPTKTMEECIPSETEPCLEDTVSTETLPSSTQDLEKTVGGVILSDDQMKYIRTEVPYFKDFTDDEFYNLMKKAKLLTFDEGSIIMRQGMPGKMFYIIESGEVEISVKTAFEDPLTTPASYLGAVVNTLTKNNYFGERSLITGEPRAASIKALTQTRCFAFDIADIPSSSILSGSNKDSTVKVTDKRIQQINDKYGLDMYDIDVAETTSQIVDANKQNQKRGSANTPGLLKGVDIDVDDDDDVTDFEFVTEDGKTFETTSSATSSTVQESSSKADVAFETDDILNINPNVEDVIIPLLVRFKLIRYAARCFEYIMKTKPKWGDAGELRRRSILVARLTVAQKTEFTDVFNIIDASGDGIIELIELKRVMESIGEEKSNDELEELINKSNPNVNGNTVITYDDFMGVMAEAEFYHLFKDTFAALDVHNSGFVKAEDLDRVLCGVRDLISDDQMSIIDVDDKDMMIDYEQFSKMLLGTGV